MVQKVQDMAAYLWLLIAVVALIIVGARLALGKRKRRQGQPALDVQDPQALAGTLVGPWRLLRCIGQGGMAVVYEAVSDTNLSDGEHVALKLMLPDSDAERFRREIVMTSQLSHPNIVRVLEHGDVDGVPYLVMELMSGQNLQTVCEQQRMDVPQFLRVFAAMVKAVDHAHQQGVVHRDLKPANIFLRSDGRPVVCDFGIARTVDASQVGLTPSGLVMGTPVYVSPEQFEYLPATPLSDQYSLGLIAYEMLTGKEAFTARQTLQLLADKIMASPPSVRTLRPDLPERLVQMIERMMAVAPGNRYLSLRDVVSELEACEGDVTAG